jgi:hypothetical protein
VSARLNSSHLISSQLNSAFLRFSKLAQSGFKYSFVLLCKTCKQVLYTNNKQPFTHSKLLDSELLHTHTSLYLHEDAFPHSKFLRIASFYTQQPFTHCKLLHTEAFTNTNSYTERPFHREAFAHRKLSHTQQAFTHRSFCTEHLFTASFYTQKAHTHGPTQ